MKWGNDFPVTHLPGKHKVGALPLRPSDISRRTRVLFLLIVVLHFVPSCAETLPRSHNPKALKRKLSYGDPGHFPHVHRSTILLSKL